MHLCGAAARGSAGYAVSVATNSLAAAAVPAWRLGEEIRI